MFIYCHRERKRRQHNNDSCSNIAANGLHTVHVDPIQTMNLPAAALARRRDATNRRAAVVSASDAVADAALDTLVVIILVLYG